MCYDHDRMPVRSRTLSGKKTIHRRTLRSATVHASVARRPVKVLHHPRVFVQARHPHSHKFWMIVTLGAFPVALTFATALGWGSALSFIAGAVSSLLVLLLNALLEHELWMLDVHWKVRFEDPDFSHRLLVIAGALLLVVETSFFLLFLADQSFAGKMMQLLVAYRG